MPNQQRQLAAILFTDIVGYTAMMQKDEQHAVSIAKKYISVLKQMVLLHEGTILNDYGDGSLCTFSSVRDALNCSIEMQRQYRHDIKVPLRIGLHIGEIFFEDGKVFGDGVNITSRIQSLGQANTILFSKEVFDKIHNQPEFKCVLLGSFEFKNVDDPMKVFALANEELTVPRKEEMSGKLKEIKKKSSHRKWITAAVGVIILVASYFIYQNIFYVKEFSGEKSIAVLPFENIGMPDSEEYISDGITQDIINNLSKISSFQKVIAWFSVRGFKKTTKSLKQIGDELDVAAILSGTMEKHEGKVHINAELVEVSTNKRLWGDDFEYDSKDILSIQSKVSGEIIGALKLNISPEEKKNLTKNYTDNPEAYRLYRRGRSYWDKRNRENFDSAEANYNRAIKLDPDYALAYSGLADLYIYNQKGLSQLEAIPIARDYADKALSIDSSLVEALTTIGFIQSAFDYDWVNSKKTLAKAIALNPNYPTAHLFYGNLLQYTGENTDEGIGEIKKALALDPLSFNLNYVLGRNYYYARKYDSAYEQFKKTLALDRGFSLAKGNLVYVLLALKKYTEAFELIKQLDSNGISKIDYNPVTILSYTYAATGNIPLAKSEMEKSIKEAPDQSPFFLAQINIMLNNFNEALNRLEQAYDSRDIWMYCLKADPTFDPIRNEPRFKKLMKKMRLE